MGSRAALITQADIARVARAMKSEGVGAYRIEIDKEQGRVAIVVGAEQEDDMRGPDPDGLLG